MAKNELEVALQQKEHEFGVGRMKIYDSYVLGRR